MLIYIYSLLTFLLPLLALWNFLAKRNTYSYNWWSSLILFLLVYLFTFQAGGWPYIGFNWRYYSLIIYIILALVVYIKFRKKKIAGVPKKSKVSGIIISILIVLFCYTNLEVWNGGNNNQEAINLEFPLKNGTYVIMQGGDSEIGNAAHRYKTPHSYALDIVELNAKGKRGSKLFSKDLRDYEIYGDTIYSPCDAIVINLNDGVEENEPPVTNTEHRGGNHVVLKQGEIKILICHMQKNSILVQRGQEIKTGEPIGLVGNTGYTIEPHLHIQAYSTIKNINMMVPMRFNGRFLNMNDVVRTEPSIKGGE